jgi:HEAT repeat protein
MDNSDTAQEFESLLQKLGSDDWHERMDAAHYLGELDDIRAVEPLITALRDENIFVRESAADALSLFRDPGNVETLNAFETLLAVIGWTSDTRNIESFLTALQDEDSSIGFRAAVAVAWMGKSRWFELSLAVKILLTILFDSHTEDYYLAAVALGWLGELSPNDASHVVESLITVLNQEHWRVDSFAGTRAVYALSRTNHPRAFEPLLTVILPYMQGNIYGDACFAAIIGMRRINYKYRLSDPRAVELLIDVLQHNRFRIAADDAHHFCEDPRNINYLINILGHNENREIYFATIGVLSQIGTPAIGQLTNVLLHDENQKVRFAVTEALGQIGTPAVGQLINVLLREKNQEVRSAVTEALGWIGTPAVEPLIAVLRDGSITTRFRAVDALSRIGTPEALAAIESWRVERGSTVDSRHTASGTRKQQTSFEKTVRSPHFSVFYPRAIIPNQAYALMAFVHLESALEQVRQVAAGYVAMMGNQSQSGTTTSKIAVDPGSLITLVPDVPLVQFDPPEQIVPWQPPQQSTTFLFTTSADLSVDLSGRVIVYQGPLVIGEIPIHMKLLAVETPVSVALTKEDHLDRFDPIFASYSHRDMPVMEYFRRVRATVGQRMLVDVYDLRAGEHWADRLLEMIDQSAVFQLFWSQHSAKSNYCRQEWEQALKVGVSRPRFIQPVWWDEPMISPPPELADLHFQRVPIPPLTRAQLAVSRLRRWFR